MGGVLFTGVLFWERSLLWVKNTKPPTTPAMARMMMREIKIGFWILDFIV